MIKYCLKFGLSLYKKLLKSELQLTEFHYENFAFCIYFDWYYLCYWS